MGQVARFFADSRDIQGDRKMCMGGSKGNTTTYVDAEEPKSPTEADDGVTTRRNELYRKQMEQQAGGAGISPGLSAPPFGQRPPEGVRLG
jgi:hypothetical protein